MRLFHYAHPSVNYAITEFAYPWNRVRQWIMAPVWWCPAGEILCMRDTLVASVAANDGALP